MFAANRQVVLMVIMCTAVMSVDDGWKRICKAHCKTDGDPMLHNKRVEACGTYKHVLPKPRVFNLCKNSFNNILTRSCKLLCSGKGHSQSTMEEHGSQFCQKHKRALPKPASWESCMKGVGKAGEAANAYTNFVKKTLTARIAQNPGESIESIIKEIILEGDIEESALKQVDVDEKVVVEEIRAEAEAEVKEIKEEVKAGKTDLDLAREAARAAFKAKQESESESESKPESAEVEEIDL